MGIIYKNGTYYGGGGGSGGGGAEITIDNELSSTSENPVQNKIIKGALDSKVDKVQGKGLSTEDYTTAEQTKLSGIETGAEVNTIESITLNGTTVSPDNNKNVALTVITKTVDDLTNYYTKSQTYTQAEVNTLIGAICMNASVVQELPTSNISTATIYLIPKSTAQTNNTYDEYICLDTTTNPATWEKIGDTQIDLSNYVQKSSTTGLLKNDGTIDTTTYLSSIPTASTSTIGGVKVDGTTVTIDNNGVISSAGGGGGSSYTAGDGISISNNEISTDNMSAADMDEVVYPLPGVTPKLMRYSTT